MNKVNKFEVLLKKILGNIDVGQLVRKKHFIQEIKKIGLSDKTVLDAGCGNGEYIFELLKRYPIRKIIGIEIQREKVDFIEQKIRKLSIKNVSVICKSLTDNLPFSNKFDFVYTIDVLEHIIDYLKAIKNIHNSLKYGCLVFIHVPNTKSKRFFKQFENYHQIDHVREGYNLEDLIAILKNFGFEIIRSKYTINSLVELVWEIEKTLERILPKRISQFICYPLTFLSVFIDTIKVNHYGNGILILAKK